MKNFESRLIHLIRNDSFQRSKNARKEELRSRHESLNEEEKAELMGLNIFPDNPRGAELRKKEALGLIIDEEKEELKKLYQLQTRQKENSPAVQRLWDRVESNDPNVEIVDMGSGKSIEVAPIDEKEKVIWTFGLCGCCASAVFAENEDGTRTLALTHYPPISLSSNIAMLNNLIDSSEKMKIATIKKAILVLPGEWMKDPKTEKYEMKVKNQQTIDVLTATIKAKLGADVEMNIEPYSEYFSLGEKDQGVFVLYVPPFGKGDVRYSAWFNSKKITD